MTYSTVVMMIVMIPMTGNGMPKTRVSFRSLRLSTQVPIHINGFMVESGVKRIENIDE